MTFHPMLCNNYLQIILHSLIFHFAPHPSLNTQIEDALTGRNHCLIFKLFGVLYNVH